MGRRVENIKATKKVSWCKTRTQKGRGKMAAEVQSWSQQFQCLNVLGFPRRLARMCGLSIRPDIFCCLPVLKTGVAKSAESWSQCFVCLNVLGFQQRLASICGLAICPDRFCCLPVLKTGEAKWLPNVRCLFLPK